MRAFDNRTLVRDKEEDDLGGASSGRKAGDVTAVSANESATAGGGGVAAAGASGALLQLALPAQFVGEACGEGGEAYYCAHFASPLWR